MIYNKKYYILLLTLMIGKNQVTCCLDGYNSFIRLISFRQTVPTEIAPPVKVTVYTMDGTQVLGQDLPPKTTVSEVLEQIRDNRGLIRTLVFGTRPLRDMTQQIGSLSDSSVSLTIVMEVSSLNYDLLELLSEVTQSVRLAEAPIAKKEVILQHLEKFSRCLTESNLQLFNNGARSFPNLRVRSYSIGDLKQEVRLMQWGNGNYIVDLEPAIVSLLISSINGRSAVMVRDGEKYLKLDIPLLRYQLTT